MSPFILESMKVSRKILVFISLVLFLEISTLFFTNESAKASFVQRGKASWVGERFQGRKTESGEVFDLNDLTAFHASIPLGTEVKITAIKNNRSVIVRIIGRSIPRGDGRIIELSKRAASMLDILNDPNNSLVKVEELFSYNDTSSPVFEPEEGIRTNQLSLEERTTQYYVIQYGSFWDLENAVQLKKSLYQKGVLAEVATVEKEGQKLYRVNSLDVYPTSLEARCSLLFQKPQYGIIKSIDNQNQATTLSSGERSSEQKLNSNLNPRAEETKASALSPRTNSVEEENSRGRGRGFEYGIQFGAFQSVKNAEQLQKKLEGENRISTIIHKFPNDNKNLFRVLSSSPFKNRFDAEQFLEREAIKGVVLTFVK